MSKMDALRAMREARYEEQAKRAAGASSPARRPAATPKKRAAAPAPAAAAAATETPAGDELCGHRSINGRTCTRERGHTAKNHRYS